VYELITREVGEEVGEGTGSLSLLKVGIYGGGGGGCFIKAFWVVIFLAFSFVFEVFTRCIFFFFLLFRAVKK